MGYTTVYLLPESDAIDPKQYGERVKTVLLEMGVIDNELYDDMPDWYAAGPNSLSPLREPIRADEIGFEYCIIAASPEVEVVPQDPAVEPRCPGCSSLVSDAYYDLVNDIEFQFEGRTKSQKYIEARVSCPQCKRGLALPELKDEVGIFLSGTWVNFQDVQSEFQEEWLADFNSQTGWQHRALTYWYT